MSTYAPEGYTNVAPWVVTDDTGAFLDFVTTSFDGVELARVPVEDGSIGHGEIRVGDTVVLAFDRHAEWPVMPSLLRVFVPDADAAMKRAVEAGANVVTEVSDSAFGQRGGRVRDPFGNIWWVMAQVETVAEDEMWRRLQDPTYAEGMRVAQETLDAELSGRSSGRSSTPIRADCSDEQDRQNAEDGEQTEHHDDPGCLLGCVGGATLHASLGFDAHRVSFSGSVFCLLLDMTAQGAERLPGRLR